MEWVSNVKTIRSRQFAWLLLAASMPSTALAQTYGYPVDPNEQTARSSDRATTPSSANQSAADAAASQSGISADVPSGYEPDRISSDEQGVSRERTAVD